MYHLLKRYNLLEFAAYLEVLLPHHLTRYVVVAGDDDVRCNGRCRIPNCEQASIYFYYRHKKLSGFRVHVYHACERLHGADFVPLYNRKWYIFPFCIALEQCFSAGGSSASRGRL